MRNILAKIQVIYFMRQLVFYFHKIILSSSVFYHSCFGTTKKYLFSIGVDEVASFLKNTSRAFPNSYSVCLFSTTFYKNQYDINLAGNKVSNRIKRIILGPWFLGRLTLQTDNFIYIGLYFITSFLGLNTFIINLTIEL